MMTAMKKHRSTLTVDPVNDAGSFSGDTSGTGAEDEDFITGTLTFTDANDGDSATHLYCEFRR